MIEETSKRSTNARISIHRPADIITQSSKDKAEHQKGENQGSMPCQGQTTNSNGWTYFSKVRQVLSEKGLNISIIPAEYHTNPIESMER